MKVPLLDLQAQHASIRREIEAAVLEVLDSQQFILGSKVEVFERAVAGYSGAGFGVGVSSGTDALLIALMAEGIGPADEVVTTPYTFFATAGSIARLGAKPVFVDIDPLTFNIDVRRIEAAITRATRAIMPVHLFGHMADMDTILAVADAKRLVVIEDAAQAIGAEFGGRRAGSLGDYGCFSFFPSKNLGGAGDGGMVVVNDADKAARLRQLRNHGMEPKYFHSMVGGNFRLDALQAAVLDVKLSHLDRWTGGRVRNARLYREHFEARGLVASGAVRLPCDPSCCPVAGCRVNRHIFNQFVIRVAERDALRAHLLGLGIGCEVYYPVPLHLQESFRGLGYAKGDFPESERAAAETLALPIYPELTEDQIALVVDGIATFCGR